MTIFLITHEDEDGNIYYIQNDCKLQSNGDGTFELIPLSDPVVIKFVPPDDEEAQSTE